VPKPILQALVLAEHVYDDVRTRNKVIAGTFNRLLVVKVEKSEKGGDVSQPAANVTQQPDALRKLEPHEISRMGSPFVYISLTEVRGTVPLELRYVDLADNRVLLRMEFAVKADDPLATIEAIIQVPPVLAPHEGVFALELLSNDEPLGFHRVTVDSVPDSGPQQETGEDKP
jgi:hypothetical protein